MNFPIFVNYDLNYVVLVSHKLIEIILTKKLLRWFLYSPLRWLYFRNLYRTINVSSKTSSKLKW
jgi:hypothetical protein